jgi:hypothetical protein
LLSRPHLVRLQRKSWLIASPLKRSLAFVQGQAIEFKFRRLFHLRTKKLTVTAGSEAIGDQNPLQYGLQASLPEGFVFLLVLFGVSIRIMPDEWSGACLNPDLLFNDSSARALRLLIYLI